MDWSQIAKARQQLSRERGAISKDWGGKIAIALAYPNSYYLGMSNLGLHALYSLFNNHDKVVCERVFWEKENQDRKSAPLSIESQRPLADFDVIAFTISYELDYFNVVQIIKASGMPLYAADRNERHPLIIAGGPCVTANPAPISPFFDCLCLGEAEPIIPGLLNGLQNSISEKRGRLLEVLAEIPGIYVPLLPPSAPVSRQWAADLNDYAIASAILTPDTELGDLYLIETERGCNWGCRFCLVNNAFRPARFRSIENILAQAKLGLQYRKRLGLVGAAVTDYPQLEELLVKLRQQGAGLSVSSLRIKNLSHVVLAELVSGGIRTITLAPEAGSERLRQVIKKGITEDDILAAVSKVAQQGIKQLKLYFMIGLPTETDEDIAEIIKLTLKCKDILDKNQVGSRIALNVSPFVPKAGTPFQWLPMAHLPILNQRLTLLRNSLSPRGIKLKSESPAWSQIQGVLARGDDKISEVLANIEGISLPGWRKTVEKYHLDVNFYAHQKWGTNQKLPWSMVDLSIKPGQLELELNQALR